MADDAANTPQTPQVPQEQAAPAQPVPAAPATPGVPQVSTQGGNDTSKNVFTELFENDATQQPEAMMDTVVKQQENKKRSFLPGKNKPKSLQAKSFKVKENTPGKILLQLAMLLLVVVGAVSYSQNAKNFSLFGANMAGRAEIAEEQVAMLRAETAVQKHLTATLLLDKYLSEADEYFFNLQEAESSYNSANKQDQYAALAEALRPEVVNTLTRIQELFKSPLTQTEITDATTVVNELIAALEAKKGEVDESALLQDIQDLETTRKLLGNGTFKNIVTQLNMDTVSDANLETVFDSYGTLNQSVSAVISSIRDNRLEWSLYLEEVEDLVKKVDPLFNTEYEGNLTLKDVQFSSSRSLTISGQTLTNDTKNFTLISNLVDVLEDSPHFMNVEERSYRKSNTNDDAYLGNFQITLELEQ